MMSQIVAARVFAPFLGTSTPVWGVLMGTILGSLSLGCWLGGKLANKKPTLSRVALFIFLASIYIGLVAFINVPVLSFLQHKFSDIQLKAIMAALVFFAPPSLLLGMVFPHVAKLQITELSQTSSVIGKLSALFTLGSIAGAFLTIFVLLVFIGTQKLILLISAVLLVISFIVYITKGFSKKAASVFSAFFLLLIICFNSNKISFLAGKIDDVDTEYSRVWVYDITTQHEKPFRRMQINTESSSSMFLDSDDLVNYYTKAYDLMGHFNKNFHKTLMVGGAGYSYPKYFLSKHPKAYIDVVEIDKGVTDLAKKHFNLRDNPRLNIYHEDARTFLNSTKNKYDVILGDGFMSSATPFHLATREMASKMFDALSDGGLVVTNIISSVEGESGKVLRAAYVTFKTVFPQVYVIGEGTEIQNVILVAIKSNDIPDFSSDEPQTNFYLQKLYTAKIPADVSVLTDDYAPVDYYSARSGLIWKITNKFKLFAH